MCVCVCVFFSFVVFVVSFLCCWLFPSCCGCAVFLVNNKTNNETNSEYHYYVATCFCLYLTHKTKLVRTRGPQHKTNGEVQQTTNIENSSLCTSGAVWGKLNIAVYLWSGSGKAKYCCAPLERFGDSG